jgi:hypothetical protein
MKKVTALLAATAMLVLPAVASAQTPLGYGPTPNGTVQSTIANSPTPPKQAKHSGSNSAPAAATSTPAATEKGSLPFTGLEVGIVAAAGLALVATGVGLRKMGSARSAS